MIPVLEGRLPLLVAVDRARDIEAALRLARDFNVEAHDRRRRRSVDGGRQARRGQGPGPDRRDEQHPR